ncbi:peptidylprolyl isomerase [Sediminibacterium ginsengisoli]|uniref:Periplasmic chaperone PpiD n=1 Tax=Sediminibacterium ginsengisoli TaxID=413434 RepID=A0A1T4MET9_9BACT|nr:SurA N-terminal domain-containing protein [Sediminibacterium ginsengisoli]SJZ65580.1 peptidyl-prolyl cis-trans isomerase D [Sediminibacterium ginsengisoli]
MSVIQRIRDKGAWIIFAIIALALIAFILQDGVGRGGSAFSNTTVIGKVNGEKIDRADFEQKLTMAERMYAAQGAQREQLIGSIWNQEVERIVMDQEFEKLGLQVGPKELADLMFGDNSPLRQEFTDPKTGVFNADEARKAFAQLKKSKNAEQIRQVNEAYVEPTIQGALRSKYQGLLQGAVYIPKWLVAKQQADNNAIANISYVYVPYASVSDSTAKVTDDEINAYVKKNSRQFTKDEETRSITYVAFNAAPSSEDSLNVYNQVASLKNEFAATADAQVFVTKTASEMPYYDSYFSKARMQQSNKDTLVKIPVGTVYGPYLDGNNFVLAKMVSTKQWPDSAKVRHILIGTMNPQTQQVTREDSVAKKLADSIETAVRGGADFNALVAKYSDDGGSKEKGGVYEFFPQGQMVVPFNDFAFDKPVGSKGVVKTDFGYHYIEVLAQKNVNPVYKIAYVAKPIMASNETVSAANTAAAQFAAAAKGKKEFEAAALKGNLALIPGNEIKQNDFTVNGLGQSRSLVRWVYEHKAGDVSEPMEVGDRYIVAIISAVNKAGLMSSAEARPFAEGLIRNEKKAKQIIESKFKGNSLENYAASSGSQVMKADSIAFSAPFIPNIGSEPKVIGASFNKAFAGKASEPIAGVTGVFAIKIDNSGARANAGGEEAIRQNLIQSGRMAVYRSLEALRKSADVKDNRSKFY